MRRVAFAVVASALVSLAGVVSVAMVPGASAASTRADGISAFDHRNASASARYLPKARRWYSSTVRFANTSREWAIPVRRAAAAWNASGAHVRWVRVPKKRAQLIIYSPRSGFGAEGQATVYGRGDGVIRLARGFVGRDPDAEMLSLATRLAAHEMGHIIGLDHSVRGCAVMQAFIGTDCPTPSSSWQSYCRILEPDDVQGATKLWGGRVRPFKQRFCDLETEPAAVEEFSAVPVYSSDSVYTRLSWHVPRIGTPAKYLIAAGDPGYGCPVANDTSFESDYVDAYEVAAGKPGGIQSITRESGYIEPPGATTCFSIRPYGKFDRPGPPVEVTVEYQTSF